MTFADIAAQRLHNQHLLKPLGSPKAVLRLFGAMQAQDFQATKWAIGLRCNTTDQKLTELFNKGKILRTHMLRPTWHFVLPEDIRWIQMLTAPRVHAFNKHYYKKMNLDEATLKKGADVLAQALEGGKQLKRDEVQAAYLRAGIKASGLRLAYLVMYAQLENIICSGAMQGKQHTVALTSERAPHAKKLSYDEALRELAKRFFTIHGPATIKDFAWWSSLLAADIKRGIELAGLESIEVGNQTFYFAKKSSTRTPSPVLHLLPNYDEYAIAYKERRPYNSGSGQSAKLRRSLLPSHSA